MTINESAKRAGATTIAKKGNESASARTPTSKPNVPAHQSGPDAMHGTATSAQSPAARPGVAAPTAPAKKLTYEERMRRLAPIVQVRRKVESTITRFANLADEVKRWRNAPDLREAATKVETALAGLLAEATTTADTFQPERERRVSASQLTPGEKVALREKFVARYEGVLDPAERATLEVVTTTRGHVSVKTATGARIVLPRGHVARATDTGERPSQGRDAV